jgi:hypothetical protein
MENLDERRFLGRKEGKREGKARSENKNILHLLIISKMGPRASSGKGDMEIHLQHSRLKTAKLVNREGGRVMMTCMGVDDREYKEWKSQLASAKIISTYLLLPLEDTFSTKALCGTAGILEVVLSLYSWCTQIVPIC